jgi:hypothetical protein
MNEVAMIVTAMSEREKGVIYGAITCCRAASVPQRPPPLAGEVGAKRREGVDPHESS